MSEQVELELKLKGGDNAVKTLGQLERELDKAREAIKGVEVGSDAFNKLATQIQNASSEVKTLEKQMEGLEPQQKAEAFLKMGEGIAGGFAIGQASMALLGVESENLEKIQVKVQSAIAIAQGVRMMSEAALMFTTAKRVAVEKLGLITSKVGTAVAYAQATALGAWATVQGVLTGAISASSVALKILKLAIIATGIGALVLAIIAIGVAVFNWVTATNEAAIAQANLNKEIVKNNNEFLKNRELQKQLSEANTDSERALVNLQNALNEQTQKLKDNSESLNKNAERLSNLGDYSEEVQKKIKNGSEILAQNSTTIQGNIDKIDALIKKKKEEIEAEEQKVEEEKQQESDRKQRSSDRRSRRKAEAAELLALEQELSLMLIEDEDEREKAALELQKQNDIKKASQAKNSEEQIFLIKKKYAILEEELFQKQADRRVEIQEETQIKLATEFKDFWEKKQVEFDKQKEIEKQKDLAAIDAANEFIATAHHQVIEQLQAHMGARLSELDKQKNKEIALAESQGKSTEGIEKKFQAKREQIEKRQKKIAVAQALIQTYESATASYNSMARIPYVGPALGAAAAGLAISAGLANVRQILAQDVGGGVGGSGGGGGNTPPSLQPPSSGEFTLGGAQEQQSVKAFVVESEITDSQAQMADINRRSTI